MANFIFEFEGARGRSMKLYDTKVIIETKKTVGSLMTGNFTDGEKTIYLCDVVGVQFKESAVMIGYLQFETPSMQMNNQNSNMFSENTFTFENGKNGITNKLMKAVYLFVTDRIEELKYGVSVVSEIPDFEFLRAQCQGVQGEGAENNQSENNNEPDTTPETPEGEQCELCGDYVDHLTSCKIKDEYGTRYRSICDDCIAKTKAKPQRSSFF